MGVDDSDQSNPNLRAQSHSSLPAVAAMLVPGDGKRLALAFAPCIPSIALPAAGISLESATELAQHLDTHFADRLGMEISAGQSSFAGSDDQPDDGRSGDSPGRLCVRPFSLTLA